jgi:hypothetical protein
MLTFCGDRHMKNKNEETKQFEIDVRNIARQLWDYQNYTGSITLSEKERDSIFVTEEVVHYIEITTSKSEKKAIDDLRKINEFMPKLSEKYPEKIIKGWWITLDEPTGEQGKHIENYSGKIFHNTYAQFLSKLIDSREYLRLRMTRPFGSARDIVHNSINIPENEFVPSILIESDTGEKIYYHKFRDTFIKTKAKYLVTGEFGVGKSMLSRQIFLDLSRHHKNGSDRAFPIYINLRDHGEQKDPDECLRRHGKSIGFPHPDQLVRAWLAGYTYLILDGFDELTPILATRDTGKAKEVRKSAMELVRRFVSETPDKSSIIILGRSNFFDTQPELISAIGIKSKTSTNYSIPDFTDEQISLYLGKRQDINKIPSWLPKRPLLIGYLIGQRLLSNQKIDDEADRVKGWDSLINFICNREVEQVYLALEPNELKLIYSRIATKSRKKADPLGPISLSECRDAFFEIIGFDPEGRSLTALMRLPGLIGGANQEVDTNTSISHPGSRWFIDKSFQSSLAGIDLCKSIEACHEFDHSVFMGIRHHMIDLGIEIAINNIADQSRSCGIIVSAFEKVAQSSPTNPCLIDYFYAIQSHSNKQTKPKSVISNLIIKRINLFEYDGDLSGVEFNSCYIEKMSLSRSEIDTAPLFKDCIFEKIETHFDLNDLEDRILMGCKTEEFIHTYSSFEQYKASCPNENLLVLCSILDKIFIQSRSGRKESTLYRGLQPNHKDIVRDIIEILRKEGYISKIKRRGEEIWTPDLAYAESVGQILRNPNVSKSSIIEKVRAMR